MTQGIAGALSKRQRAPFLVKNTDFMYVLCAAEWSFRAILYRFVHRHTSKLYPRKWTRKKFSAVEQELVRANPYTEKVTENQISFTLAFKEAFWRLSVEGCTGKMALRKLGYDPELLGFERVHNITKRIRRAGKSPEGIQPAPKSRMRISREQFGAAELEKMSRRESERRMQQEIVYLQQQMAFLKKLMRQPESADSDT